MSVAQETAFYGRSLPGVPGVHTARERQREKERERERERGKEIPWVKARGVADETLSYKAFCSFSLPGVAAVVTMPEPLVRRCCATLSACAS
jgi:hypothetical protein